MNKKKYGEVLADMMKRANSVRNFAIKAQFQSGQFIKDAAARAQSIYEAAKKDPLFEGVAEPVVRQISSAWGAALAEYSNTYHRDPRDEVLASCHQTLENMLMAESAKANYQGNTKMLLESVNNMSTSEGIMHQTLFMAMILPTQLGAATSDACTFVQCDRDESKIYEIINVAGSKFGDYAVGDELDMQSVGQFSQLRRIYTVTSSADGTTKSFSFDISKKEGSACPIRPHRSVVYINRKASKRDDGEGTLLHNFTNAAGTSITLSASITYSTGVATLVFSTAPDSGTEIAFECEINIEAAPNLIPTINHKMKDYSLFPSQYVLAAEHTVQAASDAQREFGLDLGQLQFTALRNYLSHEQDMTRLRKMIWSTLHTDTFDVSYVSGQDFEFWASIFKAKIRSVYTEITNRTKSTTNSGAFAGGDAANFLRQLPPGVFTEAAGYQESPHIHFIGTLMGNINIYVVPAAICTAFQSLGIDFDSWDMLCYGRDETPGKAGFVTGDAVAAIPFQHPTNPALVNRTTLWGSAINEMHPRNGAAYFTKLTLTQAKDGAINVSTGELIGDSESA